MDTTDRRGTEPPATTGRFVRRALVTPVISVLLIALAGCVGELGAGQIFPEDDAGTDEEVSTDGDSDADADAGEIEGDGAIDEEDAADGDVLELPWVELLAPTEGAEAPNPVTFRFAGGGGVETVELVCDGWPLQDAPIPIEQAQSVYDFSGVNRSRTVVLTGYDATGSPVATDEVTFVPFQEACALGDETGFNHYTVAAINDTSRFPRDSSYPYCWGESWCGEIWGQIHDGRYGGEMLFPGGGDCFCSGHTLEVFLRAFHLYLAEAGLSGDALFRHGGSVLTVDDVDVGGFYQWWQGFGVASYSSSAEAFESVGIGESLGEDRWNEVLPGDFVNLSRSNGTGHSVIFVNWIWEGSTRVGIRYYGCNGSGDSCPDPSDAENRTGVSGPSFSTEYFEGHGGRVLTQYLFIGRVFMPETG